MTENEELLKLVGFKPKDNGLWKAPGNIGYFGPITVPDLFHDLNALDKWVVPVLRERGLKEINFQYRRYGTIDCFVFAEKDFKINDTEGSGETMAAALATAALKFLKGE